MHIVLDTWAILTIWIEERDAMHSTPLFTLRFSHSCFPKYQSCELVYSNCHFLVLYLTWIKFVDSWISLRTH